MQGKPGELFFLGFFSVKPQRKEKFNPWNKCNGGTPAWVHLRQSAGLRLFPALLSAVPPTGLMAALKAKTIAFILPVVGTCPRAIALVEGFGNKSQKVSPRGILDYI